MQSRIRRRVETYNQKIDRYIEKYSSLVKHVEVLAFPPDPHSLPEEAQNWGWLRRTAHRMSHPFTVVGNGFWDSAGYIFFTFLMQINLGWGLMYLSPALFGSSVLLSFSNVGSAISLILSFIFAIPLLVISYYWLYSLFVERGRSAKLPYVLAGIDVLLTVGFSSALHEASVTKYFIRSKADILPFLVSYIFFLIPSITYFFIIIYETLIQIRQLITAILRSIKSIHDPLPLDHVRKLVTEEIPATDGKPAWKLASLSLNEIQTLRKWAEANLEATDKRALPTLVVVGFLALFFTSETIRRSISEPMIQFWLRELSYFWITINKTPSKIFSWDYLLATFILVGTLILVRILLRTFSRLFKNLPIQSLVVEACILAESAIEEQRQEETKTIPTQGNNLIRFVQYLLNFFYK